MHVSDLHIVASYLMKTIELRDNLVGTEVKVLNEEFMPIALKGLSSPWGHFVLGVCAFEKLPTFEKLQDNIIQEERGIETILARVEEILNLALIRR